MIIYAALGKNVTVVNGMMGLAGVGTGLRFMPINLHTAGIGCQPKEISCSIEHDEIFHAVRGHFGLDHHGLSLQQQDGDYRCNGRLQHA